MLGRSNEDKHRDPYTDFGRIQDRHTFLNDSAIFEPVNAVPTRILRQVNLIGDFCE